MRTKTLQSLPLYFYESLSDFPEIRHYISTRHGGVSKGDLESLNVSFSVDTSQENVLENRSRIAKSMGIEPSKLIFPSQVHEAKVVSVSPDWGVAKSEEETQCTDALITQAPGVCLSVISADCVPLLIYDRKQLAVGAVHAGWRGTVKKIAQKTILKMQEDFGSDPQDIWVGIGPSISPEVYEVGSEVANEFLKAFGEVKNLILYPNPEGKAHVNLWEANKHQLTEIGVPESQIEIAGICTFQNSGTFFSARSAGGKGGRFACGIMLK